MINFIFKLILIEHSVGEDPEQMPHSAAYDLGLHCLHVSHKMDARLYDLNHRQYYCTYIDSPMLNGKYSKTCQKRPPENRQNKGLNDKW